MMRPIVNIIILVLLFSAPYYIYVPVIIFGILAFPVYWEALVYGLLIDTLYGAGTVRFALPFLFTLTVLVVLGMPLRNYVRLNA